MEKDIIMKGAGASWGGRVNITKVHCSECGLTLMIIPMEDKYEYEIKATTEEERIEERIVEARKESEMELAKTITRIKETGY
jgi:hypothetical protein